MSSIVIAQGRNGFMTHSDGTNTLTIPVKSWSLNEPRNLVIPVPVSNSWATNFAEGLRSARVVVNYDFTNTASTLLLSTTFWSWWLTRTFGATGFDDTPPLTLTMNNQQDTYVASLAKAESFTLAIKPGMQVGLQAVYAVPAPAAKTDAVASGYTPFGSTRPLMWNDCSFSGITGDIYGVELGYSNNHLPRVPLPGTGVFSGTNVMAGWDAGPRTCNARFDFAARMSTNTPFADGATLTIGLSNSNRVFTLSSVVPNITDDQSVDLGQVFTPWPCTVLGALLSATQQPPLWLST